MVFEGRTAAAVRCQDRPVRRILLRVTVTVAAALVSPVVAAAARAPTANERAAIVFAVRYFPVIGRQNTVQVTSVRVSSADPRWAVARFGVRDPTGQLLGTLGALLERSSAWQVVYLGAFPLTCTPLPAHVRAELLSRAACRR